MNTLKNTITFLLILLSCTGVLILPASAKTFVYISCADDGEIAALEMNLETGDLKMLGKTKAGDVVMPMAVSPDRRYLFAAIRSVPYLYVSYAIDSNTGGLTHLSTVPSPDNMVYIITDKTGRFLLGASYAAHKISVNPIGKTGFVLGEPFQVISTGRHAHAILPDSSNRFVFVPLLGVDQIMQLKFNEKTGLLTSNNPAAVKTKTDAGPRHIAFSPNTRFVYVMNELNGMVNGYAFDSESGLLKEIQSISAVPRNLDLEPGKAAPPLGGPKSQPAAAAPKSDKPKIFCADIHVTPDGKFVYASERTSSTLAAFAADSVTGELRYINSFETEKQPRGFRIDPRGNFLLAAGQLSDHCQVHRINRETGQLEPLHRVFVGKNPNWIEIVDFP